MEEQPQEAGTLLLAPSCLPDTLGSPPAGTRPHGYDEGLKLAHRGYITCMGLRSSMGAAPRWGAQCGANKAAPCGGLSASLLPQLPAPVPGSPEVGGGALGQSRGRAALDPAAPWCPAFLAPVQSCDMTCHVSRCGSLPWGHKKQEGALSPLTNLGQCRRGRTMQGPSSTTGWRGASSGGQSLCFILGLSKNIALSLTAASVKMGAIVFPICSNLSQRSQL